MSEISMTEVALNNCTEERFKAEREVERLRGWIQHLSEVIPLDVVRTHGTEMHPSLPIRVACPNCSAHIAELQSFTDALHWIQAGKTVDEYGDFLEAQFTRRVGEPDPLEAEAERLP